MLVSPKFCRPCRRKEEAPSAAKTRLAPPPLPYHEPVRGLSHLHNPDLPGDFRQTAVEVVGGQRLPPQSLVLVGPDPANQEDKNEEGG